MEGVSKRVWGFARGFAQTSALITPVVITAGSLYWEGSDQSYIRDHGNGLRIGSGIVLIATVASELFGGIWGSIQGTYNNKDQVPKLSRQLSKIVDGKFTKAGLLSRVALGFFRGILASATVAPLAYIGAGIALAVGSEKDYIQDHGEGLRNGSGLVLALTAGGQAIWGLAGSGLAAVKSCLKEADKTLSKEEKT